MTRGRRVAIAAGVALSVLGAGAAFLWWRLHQVPAGLDDARPMNVAEAERVLHELSQPRKAKAKAPDKPWNPRGGWGRKRPPSRPAQPTPYRLTLNQRQVAAIVVTQVERAARGQLGDIRVAVREHDLLAAGSLRGTALSGSVVSIAAVPSANRRGRLCLALGEPRVGGQQIPSEVIEQLSGQAGTKVPRSLCLAHRAAGLPGPVTRVRIASGNVIVDGIR